MSTRRKVLESRSAPKGKPQARRSPGSKSGGGDESLAPGIYRVRLDRCQALHGSFAGWDVRFEFTVRGPAWASRKLTLAVETGEKGMADYLCRVFAVMGVTLDDPSDLALACREVVGRHLFVEVLPGGELHVLQLATTQRVAAPESAWPYFPDADSHESGHFTEEPDLSDPAQPRFHECDVAEKAELRLHPLEALRVFRAGAER